MTIQETVVKVKNKGHKPVGSLDIISTLEHKIIFATVAEAENAYKDFGKKLKCGFITKEEAEKMISIVKESKTVWFVEKPKGTFYSDYVIKECKLFAIFEFDDRQKTVFVSNVKEGVERVSEFEETETHVQITI